MMKRGLGNCIPAWCVLLGLALCAAGCGPMNRSVRIYPPPAKTTGTEPEDDPGATLDRLLSNSEVTVVMHDSARFRGKYDGRDGEMYRFKDIKWQQTHPEPSLWDSKNSLWGSKKESFPAGEIAEIHEVQLTARGKWIEYPLAIAGIALFVLYGGIAD